MNTIKKIISSITNLFTKKEVSKLEQSQNINYHKEKTAFINSLKISNTKKGSTPKIKTLICPGDGLGIQENISY